MNTNHAHNAPKMVQLRTRLAGANVHTRPLYACQFSHCHRHRHRHNRSAQQLLLWRLLTPAGLLYI
jgi:hypothetical protein